MIVQIQKLAYYLVILCGFAVCTFSDSRTDTAESDTTSTASSFSSDQSIGQNEDFVSYQSESRLLSLPSEMVAEVIRNLDWNHTLILREVCLYFMKEYAQRVEDSYMAMSLPFDDRWKADIQISLTIFPRALFLKNNEKSLRKVSLALEKKLVKYIHFRSVSAFKRFEDKSLLRGIEVHLTEYHSSSDFSSIDLQLVDCILHLNTDGRDIDEWIDNESLFKQNWKKVRFSIFDEPSSLEVFYKLINGFSLVELEFTVLDADKLWPQSLASLDVETRERIRLETHFISENLPDVSFYKFCVSYQSNSFFQTIKYIGLLKFIQERTMLKELEISFLNPFDFEECKSHIETIDFSSLDRPIRIILKAFEYAELVFTFG